MMTRCFRTSLGALLIFAFVSMGTAGCSSGDGGETGNSEAAVDIEAFVELPLQEYSVDLTGDGVPDSIKMDLLGEEKDDVSRAEELVSTQARRISVEITDGSDEENVLYGRIFSADRLGNGQLLLVCRAGAGYLMECSILEQMGEAVYEYTVFSFEGNEQKLADSDKVQFATSREMVERLKELGEDVVLRQDVLPGFRSKIEKWFEEGTLLVGCDVMNGYYSGQEVYISDSDAAYRPEDYFDGVWERADDLEK